MKKLLIGLFLVLAFLATPAFAGERDHRDNYRDYTPRYYPTYRYYCPPTRVYYVEQPRYERQRYVTPVYRYGHPSTFRFSIGFRF